MTQTTDDQRELAEELIDLLHAEGVAEDVCALDLLDDLATLGLSLKRDEAMTASTAYIEALS